MLHSYCGYYSKGHMMNKMRRRSYLQLAIIGLLAVFLIYFLYYTNIRKINDDKDAIKIVSEAIDNRIERGFIVGIAMAVVEDNDIEYLLKGSLSLKEQRPVTKDTLFELGSITKTFTGILLSNAVLEGKIALDDPANKYLPAYAPLPSYNGKEILIKHLITHTSGLPTIPNTMNIKDPLAPYTGYTLKMFLDGLKNSQETLLFEPGTDFNYSNIGTAMVGYILAEIEGMSYAQLLKSKLLMPLEMNSSELTIKPSDTSRLAQPYTGTVEAKHWVFEPLFYPTGGLITTVADMAKYVRAQYDISGEGIFAAIQESHKPIIEVKGLQVGTGWRIEDNGKAIAHSGGTGGFSSFILVRPEEKRGVVFLSNSVYSHTDLAYRVLDPRAKLITIFENYEDRYIGYYSLPGVALFDVAKIYVGADDELRINVGFSDTTLHMIEGKHYYSKAINGSFRFNEVGDGVFVLAYFDAAGEKVAEGERLSVDNVNVQSFRTIAE